MQGRKTTTRAFRIDETVDRQLREWAEREGVSVSFLANKALRRLVEWDMYADRFGFIAMPREALTRMIELLSEDEVRELGRWAGEDVYRAFTTFMFKHLDLETVLQVIPKLSSRYTRAFRSDQSTVSLLLRRPRAPETCRHSGMRDPPTRVLRPCGAAARITVSAAFRSLRREPRLR